MLHEYFKKERTYYLTFTDQSKPNFTPRKSILEFNKIVEDKIIIFDEISDDKERDIRSYLKKLISTNKVIILTNPYGSSNTPEREAILFKENEKNILPEKSLFIFCTKQD
jgi:archaellum biogenesis ATPase FlaH